MARKDERPAAEAATSLRASSRSGTYGTILWKRPFRNKVGRIPLGYKNTDKGLVLDPARADLVRKAFELTATRSYTLEEVLRRINLLGLKTRRNRPLTKQSLSRMLRNPIYCGWVVSGENKVKGLHQPIITQSLFDAVQDALDGKPNTAPPVVHKRLNEDFPLKGFVKCASCEKKLTAGWVKGRKEKYPRYWCWNTQCKTKVSASRWMIEEAFVRILGMLEPTQELLNQLPTIAKNYWKGRLERITVERRALTTRKTTNETLNRRILLQ